MKTGEREHAQRGANLPATAGTGGMMSEKENPAVDGQVERRVRCKCCDQWVDDVRFDTCFDCASTGEERAAKRTVMQHLAKGWLNLRCGNFEYAKYDFSWAWQRLTRTGDYAKGGTFDFEGYDWRT